MLTMLKGVVRCTTRVEVRGVVPRKLSTWKSNPETHKVIVLTGATATGKSSAAEYLCTKFDHHKRNNYEIVVADSVQAIKHLNIGSNKPSKDVLEAIPHHMLDIHDPGQLYSAGEYCREASEVIADILRRGKTPLVVGGNTMVPNAPKSTLQVKEEAAELLAPFMTNDDDIYEKANGDISNIEEDNNETSKWKQAYNLVKIRKDALLAERTISADMTSVFDVSIAANDWYRLHRLLEIILTMDSKEGVVASASRFRGLVPELNSLTDMFIDMRCFFLGGDRMSLYKSIDERCVEMLKAGFLNEVAELYIKKYVFPLPRHTSGYVISAKKNASDVSPTASAAIGYRQTINYLCRSEYKDGDTEALLHYVDKFATATRNYAKRQLHWYRSDSNFLWIHDHLIAEDHLAKDTSMRIAEEIYYWTYEVCLQNYKRAVELQYHGAKELANKVEKQAVKNKYQLFAGEKRSGESYILRSCEGSLDRDELRRYKSFAQLSQVQAEKLCFEADICRKRMFGLSK